MNRFTDVENMIYHCLMMKIKNHKKVSLSELAEECHVAKSTIVKFSKKLGYSGFVQMYYHMQNEENRFDHTKKNISETLTDDMNGTVNEFVELLFRYRYCKNFVNSYGRDDMLSSYVARKLMMFDIFAPSTYDFDMVENVYLSRGLGIFCDLRENNPFDAEDIMKLAKKDGYFIIAISDEELTWAKKYVDCFIKINKTKYKTADFFEAKVIMLFELILSEFSRKYYINKRRT